MSPAVRDVLRPDIDEKVETSLERNQECVKKLDSEVVSSRDEFCNPRDGGE